jgi:hypothetical protein
VFSCVHCKSAHQLTCSAVVSESFRHNVCGLHARVQGFEILLAHKHKIFALYFGL